MDWSKFLTQLTVRVFVGALLGLIFGLFLLWVGSIENPFWGMPAGILFGVIFMPVADYCSKSIVRKPEPTTRG